MSKVAAVQHPESGWDDFIRSQRASFVAEQREAEDNLQRLETPECDGVRGDGPDQVADQDLRSQVTAKKVRLTNAAARCKSAIAAIDVGTYGVCEDCGKPIPLARMQALPLATTHTHCNSKGRH